MTSFLFAAMLGTAITVAASSHSMSGATTSTLSCTPDNPKVWVNTETHVYHMEGSQYYGNTKHGKYMCKRSAIAAHNHEAKSGKDSGMKMKSKPEPEATK